MAERRKGERRKGVERRVRVIENFDEVRAVVRDRSALSVFTAINPNALGKFREGGDRRSPSTEAKSSS